eukprot:1710-Eustigmatos_ZCMA.PRE.1
MSARGNIWTGCPGHSIPSAASADNNRNARHIKEVCPFELSERCAPTCMCFLFTRHARFVYRSSSLSTQ